MAIPNSVMCVRSEAQSLPGVCFWPQHTIQQHRAKPGLLRTVLPAGQPTAQQRQ